jgi:rhamnosyltransferase
MKTATVCILTFNGEEFLDQLLDQVTNQVTEHSYDVLVIDSGSTDGTLEICKRYPDVRLIEIDNSEFGHGKTRNLAVQESDSEFVLFLTQDAVPATLDWLEAMVEPFLANEKISCVFGKQIPRPDCVVSVKREIDSVFTGFGGRWVLGAFSVSHTWWKKIEVSINFSPT